MEASRKCLLIFLLCCFINTLVYIPNTYRYSFQSHQLTQKPVLYDTLLDYVLIEIFDLPFHDDDGQAFHIYFKRYFGRSAEVQVVFLTALFVTSFLKPITTLLPRLVTFSDRSQAPPLPRYYNFLFRLSPF